MRFSFFVIAGTLLATIAGAQAPSLGKMDVVERSVPAGPVAMLNGESISREQFLLLYHQQIIQIGRAQGSAPDDRTRVMAGLNTLGELLRRTFLLQEAQRRGIQVDHATAEKELENQLTGIQKQLKEREGKAISTDEILQTGGQTRTQALEEMREALLIEKMHNVLIRELGVTVGDDEVKKFFDDNPRLFSRPGGMKFRQIFIYPRPDSKTADEAAWAEAEKKINKALARIRAGESFTKVANDMSESTTGKPMVDVGPVPSDTLPVFFQDPAATLKPNGISDIIKSEHGYHLMQLVEKTTDDTVSLEKATPNIRELLLAQKGKEAVVEYCQPKLEASENLQIYLDLEKALAGSAQAQGAEAGS